MAQEVIQTASAIAANSNVQLVINKIEDFCKTLGLKAEQFFPYFIKQQEVLFWMGLVKLGIAILIATICYYISYKILRHWFSPGFNPGKRIGDGMSIGAGVIFMIATCMSVICVFILLLDIPMLCGRLINPLFYALQDMLMVVLK